MARNSEEYRYNRNHRYLRPIVIIGPSSKHYNRFNNAAALAQGEREKSRTTVGEAWKVITDKYGE